MRRASYPLRAAGRTPAARPESGSFHLGSIIGRRSLLLGRRRRRRTALEAQRGADLAFDLRRQLRVVLEELLGVVAALSEPGLTVGEEGARFLHQVLLHAEVQQASLARDSLSVLDVELGLAERGRDFVLHDFD